MIVHREGAFTVDKVEIGDRKVQFVLREGEHEIGRFPHLDRAKRLIKKILQPNLPMRIPAGRIPR